MDVHEIKKLQRLFVQDPVAPSPGKVIFRHRRHDKELSGTSKTACDLENQ